MATEFQYNSTLEKATNSVSTANVTDAGFDEQSRMAVGDVFKLTVEVLIAVFGVIGNAVVITVLRTTKNTQPREFHLKNLAIADLGTLLLTFPIIAIKEKAPSKWPLGEFTCRYLSPVTEVFHGASVWFIAVVALERYRQLVTVRVLVKNRNSASLQRAKAAAACVWITSFLIFSLPLYFILKYREDPNGTKECVLDWRSPLFTQVYIGSLTVLSYVLPLLVISFTYLIISRTITRSSTFIKAMKRDQHGNCEENAWPIKSARLRQNKRAKKILTPVVLVFALTMLPLNILRLTVIFWPAIYQQDFYTHLLFVISLFVILNSSANPVIYSVVSQDFRRRINNLFTRRQRIAKNTALLRE